MWACWLPGHRRRDGPSRVPVEQLPQSLAGLEVRDVLRCHVNPVAGPWVAASARLASPEVKAAEAGEFDFFLAAESLGEAAEHGLEDDFGTLLREVGDAGHLLDERRLRQSAFGYGFVCRQKGANPQRSTASQWQTKLRTFGERPATGLAGLPRPFRWGDRRRAEGAERPRPFPGEPTPAVQDGRLGLSVGPVGVLLCPARRCWILIPQT